MDWVIRSDLFFDPDVFESLIVTVKWLLDNSFVSLESCQHVPKQDCRTVPKENCQDIVKQECEQESKQVCRSVPKENCAVVFQRRIVPVYLYRRKSQRKCVTTTAAKFSAQSR